MTDPDLASLRAALAQADADIRFAVGRRIAIARQIGEAKRSEGLPLRDYATERGVVQRWKEELARLEVPPERAEALARWLIEEAVRAQERLSEVDARPGRASDILVIGGAGAMGAWTREFFRASGHRVGVLDPRADERTARGYTVHSSLERAAQDADTIVVATPMRAAPAVYRDLLKTETEAVIFDILSIKQPILPWIRRGHAAGRRITSVHPLFGPDARTLSGRNLLVLDCGDFRANAHAASLFAKSSLTITELPLERHDALMAETLALPHVISLLFGTVLAQNPARVGELHRAAPTSFLRQAEAAQVIVSENPELSFDIQTLNPASEALFKGLEDALTKIRQAVRQGDSKTYRHQMTEVRGFLDRESRGAGGSHGTAPTPEPEMGPPGPAHGKLVRGPENGP